MYSAKRSTRCFSLTRLPTVRRALLRRRSRQCNYWTIAGQRSRYHFRPVQSLMQDREARSYFVVGGAGFIGSHFVDRLLGDPTVPEVGIYDNFSNGHAWHYAHHAKDPRLTV